MIVLHKCFEVYNEARTKLSGCKDDRLYFSQSLYYIYIIPVGLICVSLNFWRGLKLEILIFKCI